jgi:F420-non-reducing hydrogenase small subunit
MMKGKKNKATIATTWLQGCSGCHISFLDLHEELFDVAELIEVKYSTLVDIKEIPEVDIGLIEGSVATEENEKILKMFRKKCKTLVSFGTCACYGGISGMRNLFPVEEVLKRAYIDTESTVDGKIPQDPDLPSLKKNVQPIDQIVKVDAYIPGCPPLPSVIKHSLISILNGEQPDLQTRNLCEECNRKKVKLLVSNRDFITDNVVSPQELDTIDEELCFLEQGVLCMGPATREGCHSRCLKGNMPCRGCMGPTPAATEQGAKMINALSSILPAGALMFNEDIVGVGYRYSMPISIIPGLVEKREKK